MIPKVIEAKYVHDYIIHLRFADGAKGDVDLSQELYGEMFEPLKDPRHSRDLLCIQSSTRYVGRMAPILRLSSFMKR